MNNNRNWILCLALCFFASTFAQAQVRDSVKNNDRYRTDTERDKDKERDKHHQNDADRDMHKRLSDDLYSRNPTAKDAVIVWDNTDDGYEGAYAVGDTKYLAVYDKSGQYVETLVEKDWDDNVPDNVRRGYDNSAYKSRKVERFWEVNEPNKRGYYLEVKDDEGNSRRVWSDRDGKFSEASPRKRDY